MLTAVTFADANRGWAVGHGGTVLHTADGGENWALQHAAGADVTLLSVWFENASHGIAVGAFGHAMETSDGGRTWTKLAVGEGDDRDRHLNGIFAMPGGPLFIAAESGTVFRSTDNGKTWATLRLPYAGSIWGGMPLRDGTAIVYGMRGHVLHTADQGRTWSDVPTGADQSFSGGVQLADGTIVLVGLGGVIARSSDGGRSFESTIRPERQNYAAVARGGAGSPCSGGPRRRDGLRPVGQMSCLGAVARLPWETAAWLPQPVAAKSGRRRSPKARMPSRAAAVQALCPECLVADLERRLERRRARRRANRVLDESDHRRAERHSVGRAGLGRAEWRDLDGAVRDRMPPAGERAHARRPPVSNSARGSSASASTMPSSCARDGRELLRPPQHARGRRRRQRASGGTGRPSRRCPAGCPA